MGPYVLHFIRTCAIDFDFGCVTLSPRRHEYTASNLAFAASVCIARHTPRAAPPPLGGRTYQQGGGGRQIEPDNEALLAKWAWVVERRAAGPGLDHIVALYYRSSTHTRSTNIFGSSISETIMRPNPRRGWRRCRARSGRSGATTRSRGWGRERSEGRLECTSPLRNTSLAN
jgi:hypothetical protein